LSSPAAASTSDPVHTDVVHPLEEQDGDLHGASFPAAVDRTARQD